MARAGKLDMNNDYVRLPSGEKLPFRGVQDVKGGGHVGAMTGAMVATSIVFFPAAPLFLFMHGTDVTIPKGHEVTVYTNTEYDPAKNKNAFVSSSQSETAKTFAGTALQNADVLKLKTAGLGDQLIIEKIKSSPANFKLDTGDMIELKKAGVADEIIAAMLTASRR